MDKEQKTHKEYNTVLKTKYYSVNNITDMNLKTLNIITSFIRQFNNNKQ